MTRRNGLLFFIKLKKQLILKLVVLFFLVLIGGPVFASNSINAGIVNGIWYSKLPFFVGDNVRIYTAIQNQSGFDIKGVVQFLDNNEIIGETSFTASNGSFIKEWTDWSVSYGEHSISAKITEAKRMGGNSEPVSLNLDFVNTDQQFADYDTDYDGIGDKNDLDRDNDGLINKEEIELGTNPLVIDTDNDGLSDQEEIEKGTDPLTPNKRKSIFVNLLSEEQFELLKSFLNQTKEKTNSVREKVLVKIEKEKAKTEEEIKESKPKPVLDSSLALLGTDEYSLKIPKENIPSWKELYNSFLGLNIYVIRRPWLLAVSCLITARFIWKIKRA
jgi:hypothetical protein